MRLTATQVRALTIIRNSDYPDKLYGYKGFAEQMWPDSLMHCRSRNGVRGAGAWLCAGSYISKLDKLGLVCKEHRRNGFYISFKGKEALLKYEKENPKLVKKASN